MAERKKKGNLMENKSTKQTHRARVLDIRKVKPEGSPICILAIEPREA